MAGSVNKVILVGNLGQDPESRSMPSGGEVVNFSVATSENWKDRDGALAVRGRSRGFGGDDDYGSSSGGRSDSFGSSAPRSSGGGSRPAPAFDTDLDDDVPF